MSTPKGRKTIDLAHLLDMHERFERSHMTGEDMTVLRVFVETVLFVSGNYEGFREDGAVRVYFRNERTK